MRIALPSLRSHPGRLWMPLSRAGRGRPWARRALAVARASAGQPAAARALAEGLAQEWPGTAHSVFGRRLLVRLAVEAADEAGSLAALGVLAAEDADAAADAAVLVAAAFPEADVSGTLGGVAGRGAGAPAVTAARAAAAGEGQTRLLAPVPNPASGAVVVGYEVAAPSAVEVAVFDALGRRVAVLHEGPLAPGAYTAALDGSALVPGVYVVRLVARAGGSGASVVGVQRVTVAR